MHGSRLVKRHCRVSDPSGSGTASEIVTGRVCRVLARKTVGKFYRVAHSVFSEFISRAAVEVSALTDSAFCSIPRSLKSKTPRFEARRRGLFAMAVHPHECASGSARLEEMRSRAEMHPKERKGLTPREKNSVEERMRMQRIGGINRQMGISL